MSWGTGLATDRAPTRLLGPGTTPHVGLGNHLERPSGKYYPARSVGIRNSIEPTACPSAAAGTRYASSPASATTPYTASASANGLPVDKQRVAEVALGSVEWLTCSPTGCPPEHRPTGRYRSAARLHPGCRRRVNTVPAVDLGRYDQLAEARSSAAPPPNGCCAAPTPGEPIGSPTISSGSAASHCSCVDDQHQLRAANQKRRFQPGGNHAEFDPRRQSRPSRATILSLR